MNLPRFGTTQEITSSETLLSGLVIAKPLSMRLHEWVEASEVKIAAQRLRTDFGRLSDLEERLHHVTQEIEKLKRS